MARPAKSPGKVTTLIVRGLPPGLIKESKACAARSGITLKALIWLLLEQEVGVRFSNPLAKASSDVQLCMFGDVDESGNAKEAQSARV